jgi:hypothetical protein
MVVTFQYGKVKDVSLDGDYSPCDDCAFQHQRAEHFKSYEGAADSDLYVVLPRSLMLVQNPEAVELLAEHLSELGIYSFRLMYAINCSTSGSMPGFATLTNCAQYLNSQIAKYRPKVVLALGTRAAYAVTCGQGDNYITPALKWIPGTVEYCYAWDHHLICSYSLKCLTSKGWVAGDERTEFLKQLQIAAMYAGNSEIVGTTWHDG